jgi:hypothetical protein
LIRSERGWEALVEGQAPEGSWLIGPSRLASIPSLSNPTAVEISARSQNGVMRRSIFSRSVPAVMSNSRKVEHSLIVRWFLESRQSRRRFCCIASAAATVWDETVGERLPSLLPLLRQRTRQALAYFWSRRMLHFSSWLFCQECCEGRALD